MLTTDRRGIRTHKFFTPSVLVAGPRSTRARRSPPGRGCPTASWAARPTTRRRSWPASGADPEWYGPFADSAERWYRKYAESALFLNHVLINPPIDRTKPVHEMEDVFVHVVEERDGGMVVSGAKMLATGSALTHATFVAQNSATQLEQGKAEDYALVFIAPLDTPGPEAAVAAAPTRRPRDSPFDHPLSSRFDENDAVIVFDNAFIPWENVLVYRDVEKATGFYAQSGFLNRYTLQAGTRLA